MKKKDNLKARGFRCSDPQWEKLERVAKKQQCTPSDLLRDKIDQIPDIK